MTSPSTDAPPLPLLDPDKIRDHASLPEAQALASPAPAGARFQLERLLGSGGLCEVHAALDLKRVEWGDANPQVALKRLLPKLRGHPQARFFLAQEFCTLRSLTHPGVVRVFDLHSEPFGICFSMECIAGKTIRQTLASYQRGMGRMAIPWASRLFATLAFLHSQGVAHGDIKPRNILLTPEARLVLIDFNVAEVTARPGHASAIVAWGLRERLRLPGHSLSYAGPERLRGNCASSADDIYAACCTVYEMITGMHPFYGLSALEAMKWKKLMPEKVRCVNHRTWSLLRDGLCFDPKDRPTAMQLAQCFAEPRFFPAWNNGR